MKFLKQSTSAVIAFGPALLPADGVTLVNTLVSALDHASTGIFLVKNGGAGTIRHATVTATTYDAYGNYLVTLDTTDTNTLGRLRAMFAAAANTLPIWEDFTVLPANVFDSLVSGSANLKIDIDTIKTQTVTAAAGVTFPTSVASPTNITAGIITTTTNLTTNNDKTGYSLSVTPPTAVQVRAEMDSNSTKLANLDATVSSRTKPADTQAAVTLVVTTTNLTTNNDKTGYSGVVSDKTGFALTAGEHTNIVSDVNTALDAATAELTSIPGTTASLRTIIQWIGQYFRFKRTTTAAVETMYKADSATSLGTSSVSDDGTTASHGKMS